MKTYDGHKITVGHKYFLISINDAGVPSLEKIKFKVGMPGCRCASCKKAGFFKLSKGGIITLDTLKYYDYHFFKDFDTAKQFCLDVIEDIAKCLDQYRNGMSQITKERV